MGVGANGDQASTGSAAVPAPLLMIYDCLRAKHMFVRRPGKSVYLKNGLELTKEWQTDEQNGRMNEWLNGSLITPPLAYDDCECLMARFTPEHYVVGRLLNVTCQPAGRSQRRVSWMAGARRRLIKSLAPRRRCRRSEQTHPQKFSFVA
jgi:hypothetical protein